MAATSSYELKTKAVVDDTKAKLKELDQTFQDLGKTGAQSLGNIKGGTDSITDAFAAMRAELGQMGSQTTQTAAKTASGLSTVAQGAASIGGGFITAQLAITAAGVAIEFFQEQWRTASSKAMDITDAQIESIRSLSGEYETLSATVAQVNIGILTKAITEQTVKLDELNEKTKQFQKGQLSFFETLAAQTLGVPVAQFLKLIDTEESLAKKDSEAAIARDKFMISLIKAQDALGATDLATEKLAIREGIAGKELEHFIDLMDKLHGLDKPGARAELLVPTAPIDPAFAQMRKFAEETDKAIEHLQRRTLAGMGQEFATIDAQLEAIKRRTVTVKENGFDVEKGISPAERLAAGQAAGQAKLAALDKLRLENARELRKGLDEEFDKNAKVGIKDAEDMWAAQKQIADLGYQDQLALATNERERLAAEDAKRIKDFAAAHATQRDIVQLTEEYTIALNKVTTDRLRKEQEQRMIAMRDDIETLQTKIGTGGPLQTRQQKDAAEQQRLMVKQQQELNKAKREGRSQDEIDLLLQKQNLEQVSLMQDEYNALFETVAAKAGEVFDIMFDKTKGGFKGLLDWVKKQFIEDLKKQFERMIAGLWLGLNRTGAGVAGQQQAVGGAGLFGGLFGGGGGGNQAGGAFGGLLGGGPGTAPGGGLFGGGSQGGGLFSFLGGGKQAGTGTNAGPSGELGELASMQGATGGTGNFQQLTMLQGVFGKGGGLFGTKGGLAGGGGAQGALAGAGLGATVGGGLSSLYGLSGRSTAISTAAGGIAGAIGGPLIGALVGAGVATGFKLFSLIHKSREKKFMQEIERDFGLKVTDEKILKQIKGFGESQFGKAADKHRFETLRSDSVQSILLAYANQTGQDPSRLPLWQKFYGAGAPKSRFEQAGGFAGGGIVPGPSTGGDNRYARVRGGEGILTPEATQRMGGASAINALNSGGGTGGFAIHVTVENAVHVSGKDVDSLLDGKVVRSIQKQPRQVAAASLKAQQGKFRSDEFLNATLGVST